MDTKRVINGTFGEVWLEGQYVGECTGFQAKIAINRETVTQSGELMSGKKITSIDGTGSMTLNKVNSRMAELINDELRAGRDPRFTVISKLADPDSYGAERISITGVAFDDLTYADWAHATLGKVEAPFSFDKMPEFLDSIAPQ